MESKQKDMVSLYPTKTTISLDELKKYLTQNDLNYLNESNKTQFEDWKDIPKSKDCYISVYDLDNKVCFETKYKDVSRIYF